MGSALQYGIEWLGNLVWGLPGMCLLLGTGLYLTLLLRGLQFTKLWHSLYLALIRRKEPGAAEGDINHFQALMTALAATVGTGNIVGVATAITAGGPGALFWMWMTGLVGMATKYAEAVLAVKYRVKGPDGVMSGGPMYYLSRGLGQPWLGTVFAVCTALAAFGIGNMVQSNSVAHALESTLGVPAIATGILLAVSTGAVIIGGIRNLARVTGLLVPIMIVAYMAGALWIVLSNISQVPVVLALVLEQAFHPTAAAGGFLGATVAQAMRFGIARGIFSNESGLGSASIAAAAAQTRHPVTQALVSMTQTFIDTLLVCSCTGFVIITSGQWTSGLNGAPLTAAAFEAGLPGGVGQVTVTLCLVLFAYSTILGWSYYGEKAIAYIGGPAVVVPYRYVFAGMVAVGAVMQLDVVWALSDVMNGLMAIPNLIGVIGLAGVVRAETLSYFAAARENRGAGGHDA